MHKSKYSFSPIGLFLIVISFLIFFWFMSPFWGVQATILSIIVILIRISGVNKSNLGFPLLGKCLIVILLLVYTKYTYETMFLSVFHPGRTFETKERMKILKNALIKYNSDFGHYPHAGIDKQNGENYAVSDGSNGFSSDTCCLTSDEITIPGWNNLGLSLNEYKSLWKGPYIVGDLEYIFLDGWDNPLYYGIFDRQLYIRSAGRDGKLDHLTLIIQDPSGYSDSNGDDIYIPIAKLEKSFGRKVYEGTLIGSMD